MANTQPFNSPLGLTAANSLVVNATALTAPGLVANSTGVNAGAATIDNVSANVMQSNLGQYISLIANLISMNVLSGNNQTLLSMTSNEVFVNTISGNTGTSFLNFTSNEIFVNTISGNSISIPTITTTLQSSVNSIVVGGNATAQTIIGANGIYVIDTISGATPQRNMAGEVILQRGTVSSVNNFLINFATEVNSGLFKSMRVVVANLVVSALDFDITFQWTTDGTAGALVTSGYNSSDITIDGYQASGDDDLQSRPTVNASNGKLTRFGANNSFRNWIDVYFYDTSTTAGRKSWGSFGLGGVAEFNASTQNVPAMVLAGGYNTSTSLVIRGVQIRTASGTFTSASWTLIGRRWI